MEEGSLYIFNCSVRYDTVQCAGTECYSKEGGLKYHFI